MEWTSEELNTVFKFIGTVFFIALFRSLFAWNREKKKKKFDNDNYHEHKTTSKPNVHWTIPPRTVTISKDNVEKEQKEIELHHLPAIITQKTKHDKEDNSENVEILSPKLDGFLTEPMENLMNISRDQNPLKQLNQRKAEKKLLSQRDRSRSVKQFYGKHRSITKFSVSHNIGPLGGTLSTGGCSVFIPQDSLDAIHTIKLQCVYGEYIFKDDDRTVITPTISLEPSNMKFIKQVVVMMPAYFQYVSNTELSDILIQMKKTEDCYWEDLIEVKNPFHGKIVFTVDHFSLYRGLMKSIFKRRMRKSILYAAFLKRYNVTENPDTHDLIFCFCPNQQHAIPQLMGDMSGNHYECVIQSETLIIGHECHIEIEMATSHPDVSVQTTSRTVSSDQLWYSNFIKKEMFEIKRQTDDIQGRICLLFSITVKSDNENRMKNKRENSGSFYWPDNMARRHDERGIHITANTIHGVVVDQPELA